MPETRGKRFSPRLPTLLWSYRGAVDVPLLAGDEVLTHFQVRKNRFELHCLDSKGVLRWKWSGLLSGATVVGDLVVGSLLSRERITKTVALSLATGRQEGEGPARTIMCSAPGGGFVALSNNRPGRTGITLLAGDLESVRWEVRARDLTGSKEDYVDPSSVVVSADRVVCAVDDWLVCLDLSNGRLLWRFDTKSVDGPARVLRWGARLHVARIVISTARQTASIDLETGGLQWAVPLWGARAVRHRALYILDGAGILAVVDLDTGQVVRQVEAARLARSQGAFRAFAGHLSAALRYLFAGDDCGGLWAIDCDSDEVMRVHSGCYPGDVIAGSTAVADRRVYLLPQRFADAESALMCLGLDTGA